MSCKEERLHEKYFGTTKTRKGTKYYINVPSLPPAIYEKFQAVRDKVGTTNGTKGFLNGKYCLAGADMNKIDL